MSIFRQYVEGNRKSLLTKDVSHFEIECPIFYMLCVCFIKSKKSYLDEVTTTCIRMLLAYINIIFTVGLK